MLILRPRHVDEVRQLLLGGRAAKVAAMRPAGFTIGAVLELACTRTLLRTRGLDEAVAIVDGWRTNNTTLDQAMRLLDGATPIQVRPFAAPEIELYAIRHPDDLGDCRRWLLYGDRFRRSMVQNGFSSELAAGIAGAMIEMAENVVLHAGPDEQHPAPAVIGYHVGNRWMSYSVVDLGRGVLSSLHQNPHWARLGTSIEALHAAVYQRASRRAQWREGNGFRQVLQSLGELHGELRFRSGDGVLTLDGRGIDLRIVTEATSAMDGLQLTITCSLDPHPRSAPVPPQSQK